MKIGNMLNLVVMGLIPIASSSEAALLNLGPVAGAPEIYVDGFNVSYTASTGVFDASTSPGFASLRYENQSADQFDAVGSFNLIANFNPDHSLAGGSVVIRGDRGSGDELLLSGTLRPGLGGSAYGYQDPGPSGPGSHDLFQFTFNATGGALLSDFLAWGRVGGINLDANFAYNGSDTPFVGLWNTDFFSANNMGTGGVFVPEPWLYARFAGVIAGLAIFVFRQKEVGGVSFRKESPVVG